MPRIGNGEVINVYRAGGLRHRPCHCERCTAWRRDAVAAKAEYDAAQADAATRMQASRQKRARKVNPTAPSHLPLAARSLSEVMA